LLLHSERSSAAMTHALGAVRSALPSDVRQYCRHLGSSCGQPIRNRHSLEARRSVRVRCVSRGVWRTACAACRDVRRMEPTADAAHGAPVGSRFTNPNKRAAGLRGPAQARSACLAQLVRGGRRRAGEILRDVLSVAALLHHVLVHLRAPTQARGLRGLNAGAPGMHGTQTCTTRPALPCPTLPAPAHAPTGTRAWPRPCLEVVGAVDEPADDHDRRRL
jgi:hypothetical protein